MWKINYIKNCSKVCVLVVRLTAIVIHLTETHHGGIIGVFRELCSKRTPKRQKLRRQTEEQE